MKSLFSVFIVAGFVLAPVAGLADGPDARREAWRKAFDGVGSHFEENTGQLPRGVNYAFRQTAYRLDLNSQGMQLALTGHQRVLGDAMRILLVGAKPQSRLSGVDRLPFAVMHRPVVDGVRRGLTAVPTYSGVAAEDTYEGIDMRYTVNRGRVQFDFLVDAGADPSQITIGFEGEEDTVIAEAGHIEVRFPVAKVIQQRPFVYQEMEGERIEVDARYVAGVDGAVQIALGPYDTSLPLVIDPVLTILPTLK